jgi:branched-chain amino acid transport system ATP-binding protein
VTYSAPTSGATAEGAAEEDVIEQGDREKPLLSCQDVRVRFGGIVALDGVSFDVPRGSIVGVIGPNGAGKTTLFNCISRLYPIDRGDILFDGQSLRALSAHQISGLGIARTFQNVALFDTLTVTENVLLGVRAEANGGFLAHALRLPSAARAEKAWAAEAAELLDLLDLTHVAHRRASELPFGSRKRVELGRALASKPRLLLLDEPLAGLHCAEIDELMRLIARIAEHLALAVLLVEHHMNAVMRVSHRIVVLDFGRKIGDGKPDDVRRDPEVIRAYLGGEA